MNKLIYYPVFLVVLAVGCDKFRQPAVALQTRHYLAVQQAAESFVPVTGNYGGEIILSAFSEPASFNPITSNPEASEFTRYIYEGLVRIDGVTLKPVPGLATSWDMSPDGLVWTFNIRPGVQWSDGAAFSANDVKFTFDSLIYNVLINPNPSRDIFTINNKKAVVEIVDSLTIKFTLPAIYGPFLRAMSQEILPQHKYSGCVLNKIFQTATDARTSLDSIVGTGPFLPESVVPSQKVVFRKNPLYWQKDEAGNRLPYLDRIVYMIVADHGMELIRLKRGELDYVMATGEDFPLKRNDTASGYIMHRTGPATGGTFIVFNQNAGRFDSSGKPYTDSVKTSWFRNVKFRKAVASAIDRKAMIDSVLNGEGYPQWSAMSPAEGNFYTPNVTHYDYDSSKSVGFLLAAGFTYNRDQRAWKDQAGHIVEFSFITNGGNTAREKIAGVVCKNLEKIGLKVNFQMLEFDSLIKKIQTPPYNWDAALIGLCGGPEPQFGENFWRSSENSNLWFPGRKSPADPWEAAIDGIFDSTGRIFDDNRRRELFCQWQRIVADELPVIYTILPERIECVSGKIGNVNPSLYGGILHSVERLYIKK